MHSFSGKSEGKRPLAERKHRLEDNTSVMCLGEIRCEYVDWIQLVQGQFQWQDIVKTLTFQYMEVNVRRGTPTEEVMYRGRTQVHVFRKTLGHYSRMLSPKQPARILTPVPGDRDRSLL